MRMVILVACLWLVTSHLHAKIVFYSHRDGNTEIYTMDSDGSNQTRLTSNEADDIWPVWSPSGQQIAFGSNRDGNWEVYVMDADGKNQRRLTHHPGIDAEPDWSPDGKQIVFISDRNIVNEDHFFNLFVTDADGGNLKQLTDLGFGTSPEWSPDGEWIAFEGDGIYAIRPDGTGLWQVSAPKPAVGMLLSGWSSDGSQILYIEAVNLHVDTSFPVIATLSPHGRADVLSWKPVKVPRMPFHSAAFSADGKSILFTGKKDFVMGGGRGDPWNIYRFGLIDKQLTQLTDNPGDDAAPHEWDPRLPVSPQGLAPTRWGEIKSSSYPYRGNGRGSIPPIP